MLKSRESEPREPNSADDGVLAAPLSRLHRQMASAMLLAARALGFSISEEAVLSSLTDGRDAMPGPDILGYRQAGRRFGLNMDVVPNHKVPGLIGMAPLIRIDLSNEEHPVRLLVADHLGENGTVNLFDDNGGVRRDPDGGPLLDAARGTAESRAAVIGAEGKVIWLRVGRKLFSAKRLDFWVELLGQEKGSLGWLREALLGERDAYRHAAMASLVISLFGLVTPMFSMVVYNTVAPNAALNTLATLAVGVAIIMIFDFIMQELRSAMVDKTARRLDVVLSRAVYEHQLNLRLEHSRGAAGTQADMLRGYTTVQEFFTSAVLLSLVDLPLSLLALALITYIGGWLALLPVLGIIAMLVLNFFLREPMERASRLSTLHGQERHGTLVETIVAAEAIRAVGAERTMRRRWRDQVATSAISGHQMRFYQQLGSHSTSLIVQVTSVVILIIGAIMISEGHLTTGALIAVGMLNSRVMSPFSQLAGLLIRLHMTRLALNFLSRFMRLPQVRDPDRTFVSRADLKGELTTENVGFRYPVSPQVSVQALKDIRLVFRPGERVAILGRNGSGKSTLLKVLAGVSAPETGVLRIDGVDLQQIDPAEIRSLIGYVQQEPLLFSGTLRDNLIAGWPEASDEALLQAAITAGVDAFAKQHPEGYGMHLGERGAGLSSGQKQAVAIAQALIRDPRVLLLDEPTSALDPSAEQQLLTTLSGALKERSLIVVTHRPAILALVNRVIVLEAGQVILDKPRDEALRILAGGLPANAAPAAASAAPAGPVTPAMEGA